jgi:hypothetical protein
MRVKVEPHTFDPEVKPEVVGRGRMLDDFCIDQDAGFAYLTTHRQNTIDRLSLEPSKNDGARISIAGDPLSLAHIGPSAIHLGKGLRRVCARRVHYYRRRYSFAAERGERNRRSS